jgi:ABC-type glycerol-3-phosphate transport system substrate-binding protein
MDAFLEAQGEDQWNRIVERGALAGDYTYDLLMTHMMMGVTTATRGALQDIAQFPNIDLSKPYWSDGATRGASVGHRLFTGLSDLSFSTNENIYCIFFNKDLMREYDVEDPYALVRNNQWTFEKFEELIRQGYVDLNGNGIIDEDDQFGYISSSAMNFLWSGGSHIMTKDALDIPVLDFLTPRTLDIYDQAFRITNNPYTWAVAQWHFDPSISIFQEGRGIFYSSQLCRVNDLRATEFDFGIVPYPKWDSAQENFYSFVDGHASMMAIPLHLPNPEWTGIIIEELSFLSFRDILPVYYDVVLNVKLVRDEESVEMLEILFDSKVFDPAYVKGGEFWGLWINSIDQERTDFVSAYERMEASAMRGLERIIDALLMVE